jgi:glycine oxidase
MTVSSDPTFEVVVVGNGSLGLSLGLVLARRGLDVAVVGDAARPFAASAAAGAMNGCFGEVTPALLESEFGRLKLAKDVRATHIWDEWEALLVEESDENAIRSADGTIVILNSIGVPEIDSAGYTAIRRALDEFDEPYEDLDAAEVEWLRPDPGARPLRAMLIPGEHAVNAPALLRALGTAFVRAGGTLIDALASEVLVDGERVVGVELASGQRISSPVVAVAAGSASHGLLRGMPEDIRSHIPAIVSGQGVALVIKTEDGTQPRTVIRTPNRAFACGLHVVPRGPGTIYVGATNDLMPDPQRQAQLGDLALLMGCTRQMRTDLVNGRIERILVGNRPVPLDGFPLIGEAGVEGLWMMSGTYRDGLHQSPLLAREMAARILGLPYDHDLDVFTPVRMPIQSLTREDCVETAVRHTLAVGYEHDWRIPEDWPDMIEEQLRRAYAETLDEIDAEFVPPPEFLAFVEPPIHAALRAYYSACRQWPLAPALDRTVAAVHANGGMT